MGITVSAGQTIRGNIVKLYDLTAEENSVKNRILQGAKLRTLFKEFRRDTPIGESILIATFCRWAQEAGKTFTLKELKKTLRLCEEQFDTETRAWLAQRVSDPKQAATGQKGRVENADLPEVSLTKNALSEESEPIVELNENGKLQKNHL